MSNLDLLRKQHEEILGIMSTIENLLKKGDLDNSAKDIAFGINTLAGKLKMHLMSEDQFLYPELMNSSDSNLKNTAQRFNSEMGQLADVFAKFVQGYNVPAKILNNKSSFIADIKNVVHAVTTRINKEENKLYPLMRS